MEPIELASALAHAPTEFQVELASRISAIRADWWKRNSHLPPTDVRGAWEASPEHAEVLRLLAAELSAEPRLVRAINQAIDAMRQARRLYQMPETHLLATRQRELEEALEAWEGEREEQVPS